MKRILLAGVISAMAVLGGAASASAATHPSHGNKAAAHTCAHHTATHRDAHGDCVSKAAKAK
jgi:hypothetical protein